MNSMKEQEIERVVNREKESKKNEHQLAYLGNEIEQIRNIKDSNEKKLLNKIRSLEQKLEERENQMALLGSGIEALNQELKMREDPSQNAIECTKTVSWFYLD